MQPPNPYGQQPQGNSYPQQQPPNPYGQQPPGNPYGQYPPVNRYPQQPPANPYGQQPQANPYPQHSQPHGQRPRSGISRRRVIFGLTALGVVAAGGLVWWSTRSGSFSLPPAFAYTHTGNNGIVFQVAWSPDGKRIAEASASLAGSPQDGAVTIQVWDADNGGNVAFYGREHGGAHSVSWSPDGKHIVSENLGTIQVWDVDSGKVVYTPDKEFSGQCFKAAWSPDGKHIAWGVSPSGEASARPMNMVNVWDADTRENVYTYQGHTDRVHVVAWSPDGKRIASGGDDHTVQVWDATTGENVFMYKGHTSFVNAVAWSPDGKRIASASSDKTVQVWDANNGNLVYTSTGHSTPVTSVAWSPDSKRIASAGDTAQVWNADNGGNVYTYTGHAGNVECVAWSPDGKRIASGGYDDFTVQVWQPPS